MCITVLAGLRKMQRQVSVAACQRNLEHLSDLMRRSSGQNESQFFHGLRRRHSRDWLEAAHRAASLDLGGPGLEATLIEIISIAEKCTDPLEGRAVQDQYVQEEFGAGSVTLARFKANDQIIRHIVRPPAEIWPHFETRCVWCDREADSQCSKCKRVRYCSFADCNKKYDIVIYLASSTRTLISLPRHWTASHRKTCQSYATTVQ